MPRRKTDEPPPLKPPPLKQLTLNLPPELIDFGEAMKVEICRRTGRPIDRSEVMRHFTEAGAALFKALFSGSAETSAEELDRACRLLAGTGKVPLPRGGYLDIFSTRSPTERVRIVDGIEPVMAIEDPEDL